MREVVLKMFLDVAVPNWATSTLEKLCHLESIDRAEGDAVKQDELVAFLNAFHIARKSRSLQRSRRGNVIVKRIVVEVGDHRVEEVECIMAVGRQSPDCNMVEG